MRVQPRFDHLQPHVAVIQIQRYCIQRYCIQNLRNNPTLYKTGAMSDDVIYAVLLVSSVLPRIRRTSWRYVIWTSQIADDVSGGGTSDRRVRMERDALGCYGFRYGVDRTIRELRVSFIMRFIVFCAQRWRH